MILFNCIPVRPDTCTLIYATIALIVSTVCGLAQPYYFGKIIQTSAVDRNFDRLNEECFMLFLFFVIGGIASLIRGWLYTLVGERIVLRIRTELFRTIIYQDISFFDANKTGELMNRLASDTSMVQSALSVNVSQGLRSIAQVLFCLVFLFLTSWKLSLVVRMWEPIASLTLSKKYVGIIS